MLDRDCSRPGDTLKATVATATGTQLTFIATYPSGGAQVLSAKMKADPGGAGSWEWRVDPSARSGPAALVVEGKTSDKQGAFIAPYRIAPSC